MPWKPETLARRAAERARVKLLPSVRCSCGAQWHGKYTENNAVIEAHRQRATCCVTVDSERPRAATSDVSSGPQAEIIERLTGQLEAQKQFTQDAEDDARACNLARHDAVMKLEAHASLVQEMETYLQHRGSCKRGQCGVCGQPVDGIATYHIVTGLEDFGHAAGLAHRYVPSTCTCGLTEKLALLRRSAAPQEQKTGQP